MRYLNKLNIRSKSINSTNTYQEKREVREMILDEDTIVKFLFMCPEMIKQSFYTELIGDLLAERQISHVVIDEAHCIVDKAFRAPSYEVIKELREVNDKTPFIALTTGDEETLAKIELSFGMTNAVRIIGSPDKPNIFYEIIQIEDDQEIDLLKFFEELAPDFTTLKAKEMPSGIIYCQTYEELDKIVERLAALHVPSTVFHSKLKSSIRFDNYDNWVGDKFPIIVATTESFGLGIVKKCVKFVLHVSTPKNLRAYYQVTNIKKLLEITRNLTILSDYCRNLAGLVSTAKELSHAFSTRRARWD